MQTGWGSDERRGCGASRRVLFIFVSVSDHRHERRNHPDGGDAEGHPEVGTGTLRAVEDADAQAGPGVPDGETKLQLLTEGFQDVPAHAIRAFVFRRRWRRPWRIWRGKTCGGPCTPERRPKRRTTRKVSRDVTRCVCWAASRGPEVFCFCSPRLTKKLKLSDASSPAVCCLPCVVFTPGGDLCDGIRGRPAAPSNRCGQSVFGCYIDSDVWASCFRRRLLFPKRQQLHIHRRFAPPPAWPVLQTPRSLAFCMMRSVSDMKGQRSCSLAPPCFLCLLLVKHPPSGCVFWWNVWSLRSNRRGREAAKVNRKQEEEKKVSDRISQVCLCRSYGGPEVEKHELL